MRSGLHTSWNVARTAASNVLVFVKVVGAGGGRQSIKNEKSELQLVSPSGEGQHGPNQLDYVG